MKIFRYFLVPCWKCLWMENVPTLPLLRFIVVAALWAVTNNIVEGYERAFDFVYSRIIRALRKISR